MTKKRLTPQDSPPRKPRAKSEPPQRDPSTPSRGKGTGRVQQIAGKPEKDASRARRGTQVRPPEVQQKSVTPWVLRGSGKPADRAKTARSQKPKPLDIVMIASEVHPFATTGGLAEVLGSLPQALARLGHTVTIVMPHYRQITAARSIHGAGVDTGPPAETVIEFGKRRRAVRFRERPFGDRVLVVFVDVPELFDRAALYGEGGEDYRDNAFRFAFLSRAAIEYIRQRGRRPSVIHAHDWQAGLVPAYQKMLFSKDPIVGGVPAVFTIHNLAFQGLFPAATLEEIGLPWDVFHVQAMEFYGRISYLKAGINFSEHITTVSPTFAREMLTLEAGFGFHGVMARRAGDLVGILNGIDTARWNPAADPFVPARYSSGDLAGKADAKRYLLQMQSLDASEVGMQRPLIGLVSRLTDQKGFDLFAAAADELMTLDAAWVMLGSGQRRYEDLWTGLAVRYPGRVSTTIGYDERLEHLIEAGADAFLMPSHFEPCGLNQLNSLRYGTLPIVRATGGLDDTVQDMATGFKFTDYTPAALVSAVRRALEVHSRRELWQRMQKAAMKKDYSWDVSAREYVKVYGATS